MLEDGFRRIPDDENPYYLGGGFAVNHPPANPSWQFAAVGRGHDAHWWGDFVRALQAVGFDDCLSIENEDHELSPMDSIRYSIDTLRKAI